MKRPPRIVALCAVSAGVDVVRQLEFLGCTITAVVGLAARADGRPDVAGWVDLEEIEGIIAPRHVVESYTMSKAEDRASLEALQPDLTLVVGWQRLVPEWLISLGQYGSWGIHGSPGGIAEGRGRSPQNWAIIMGARSFELSLFRITRGVDDGPVLASTRFELTTDDDIASSYSKSAIASAAMIQRLVSGDQLGAEGVPQCGNPFYFPQRLPEDGWVDWSLPAGVVSRHCRALSRPYPGLRTSTRNTNGVMWRMHPFDDQPSAPGRVDAVFSAGSFVVGCGRGRVLVREADFSPAPGDVLIGRSFSAIMDRIISRHRSKHPTLPISRSIFDLCNGAHA